VTHLSNVYVAGIDGGGSKTECALVDFDGNCVAVGHGGPSNINYTERDVVIQSFRSAITSTLSASGQPATFEAVGCTHRAAALPEITSLVVELLGCEPKRYTEGEAALGAAGLTERFGIAQIAGTGSSTFGFPGDGTSFIIGGWGMLLGDEGGAFDIAIRGLKASVRAMDGRGPKTLLLERACDHFGILCDRESFIQLVNFATRDRIATFAPKIIQAASENDEVAIRIADKTIRELSGAVIAAASRIFKPEQSFPVVLHGGVMRNPAITTGITRFVKERYPNAEIKHPVHSPGLGLALFTLHDMRRQQQSK